MRFEIKFSGHENIRSNHQKTIEITKASELSVQGDCIIGVNATSACLDLPIFLKKKLQDSKSKIQISIKVGPHEFFVFGRGHDDLTLTHDEDIVIRKSDFVCPRTLAVKCDKTSDLIPREMVQLLQNPKTIGTFTIITE
ncbi:MAG: DUF371 domain-containing protein [Nitrosopumilus sp.]|nr:DUF371 domain-containing protein [Nitrosopumilus sp.]MDH3385038.1 DUF371 domain-containing protein [Nitrosopumilus sp.]